MGEGGGQRPGHSIINLGELEITGCWDQGTAWRFLPCSLPVLLTPKTHSLFPWKPRGGHRESQTGLGPT